MEKKDEQLNVKKLLKNKIVLFGIGVAFAIYGIFQLGVHVAPIMPVQSGVDVAQDFESRLDAQDTEIQEIQAQLNATNEVLIELQQENKKGN